MRPIAVFSVIAVLSVVPIVSIVFLIPVWTSVPVLSAGRSGGTALRFLTGFLCHIFFPILPVCMISILTAWIIFRPSLAGARRSVLFHRFLFCFLFSLFRLSGSRWFLERLLHSVFIFFRNRTHMILDIHIHFFQFFYDQLAIYIQFFGNFINTSFTH